MGLYPYRYCNIEQMTCFGSRFSCSLTTHRLYKTEYAGSSDTTIQYSTLVIYSCMKDQGFKQEASCLLEVQHVHSIILSQI
jgi:hypothetical protein